MGWTSKSRVLRLAACAAVLGSSLSLAPDVAAQRGRGKSSSSAEDAYNSLQKSREEREAREERDREERELNEAMHVIGKAYASLSLPEQLAVLEKARLESPQGADSGPSSSRIDRLMMRRLSSFGLGPDDPFWGRDYLPWVVEQAIISRSAPMKNRFAYRQSAVGLGIDPSIGAGVSSPLQLAGVRELAMKSIARSRLQEVLSSFKMDSLTLIRSDIPVPGLYRLSADGTRLVGTDLSGSPIEGRTENDIQFVGINALLRGMQPAPVRGEPLRVALLRDEGVSASSMDAAMLSLALMAQREYGVSAIEWVDPGAEASGGWRPFFAGSEASPLPTSLLVGRNGERSDPVGAIRMHRDEAAGETVVSMQIVEATQTRPGVFVRAVARTNALARRIVAMLRAWWSPELARRSDEDLQAELDTLVREQLSAYLDRNPDRAADERTHGARVELHIERGVNQMWVDLGPRGSTTS